ncbi:hypothetical protein SEPCBS119000_001470 [Sporothrix epigloea]|uniref:long-chain-alcohol oxidase n=1 Tax=Sporothrix epigloea TaxID=1892477 RepID=A0ABP0DAU4_9PEZI
MRPSAPITPKLAPSPLGDWWNETQWAVFLSLLDAVVAPVVAKGDARMEQQKKSGAAPIDGLRFNRTSYKRLPKDDFDALVDRTRHAFSLPPNRLAIVDCFANRASDDDEFLTAVGRTLGGASPGSKADLGQFLTLLSGKVGAFVFTGYCTPVQDQPVHIREKILQNWSRSWIPLLRRLARMFQALAQSHWAMTNPIFRTVTGYSDVPKEWRQGPTFSFNFLQLGQNGDQTEKNLEVLDTDIVIVGSGCGGAVCAKILAAAGHRVVVVEKGYHYPQSQLPMPQNEGTRLLFENGGILASTDPAISVVAGACWGGGGTVNWSVSLRTPDRVRQEWARGQPGMSFVTSPAFDASMDRVCDFMGVNDVVEEPSPSTAAALSTDEQSHRGRVLLDSSIKLNFKAESLLQNTSGGKAHDDGYCHLGCGSAEKKGTSVSWLPAAAKAGAQFIEGFHVERVLFEGDDGTSVGDAAASSIPHTTSSRGPRAVGVVGTWLSRDENGGVAGQTRKKTRAVIRAKKIIVACGSLWSPLVLKKSGLANPQIGQNLHLHPSNVVAAYFDEETKPMDKGILTSICTSFEDLDGEYHGSRLEPMCMLPSLALANLPWNSSVDFKTAAMRYPHLDVFIALTRDRDSGRVFADPVTGQPIVDYAPSELDREHAVEGVIGTARLCHAAGANEIRASVANTHPFIPAAKAYSHADRDPNKDDPAFETWAKEVREAAKSASSLWGGWNVATPFASAHQMGTCRMGDDDGKASVVNPRGQVWGTQGLYVADASVFPSASGVNPMVTTMAFADWIANGIAQEMAKERRFDRSGT